VKPTIELEVFLPLPAKGPHRAEEIGYDVWTGCKGVPGIIRVKDVIIPRKNGKFKLNRDYNEDSFVTYLVPSNPIFLSPLNHFVFATIDGGSAIARINPRLPPSNPSAVKLFPVPIEHGSTAVGMISGYSPCDPDADKLPPALWFTLAGAKGGGTGAFGRITGDGNITYFRTTSKFMNQAGWLHLAWAPCSGEGFPKLLLLASSIAFKSPPLRNPDGVGTVIFDKTYNTILSEYFEFYPVQSSLLHRIVTSDVSVFVDSYGSTLDVATTEHSTPLGVANNEHSDYYSTFGGGANGTLVNYINPL